MERSRLRDRVRETLASRPGALVAGGVLVLSVVLPAEGFGVSLCWFNTLFELPCPGCGLTRSVIHIGHARWEQAWQLHPFGFLVYGAALIAVSLGLLPGALREVVRARWRLPREVRDRLIVVMLLALLLFGVARLVVHVVTQTPFP